MTSFAFILGVVPLVLAAGAGSEMRRTLGTAVFGGMLGVTAFGIFLTPVFYYVIEWMADMREKLRGRKTRPPGSWKAPWQRKEKPVATAADLDLTPESPLAETIKIGTHAAHGQHREGPGVMKRR
jgi:hypothetical protein